MAIVASRGDIATQKLRIATQYTRGVSLSRVRSALFWDSVTGRVTPVGLLGAELNTAYAVHKDTEMSPACPETSVVGGSGTLLG